MSASGYGWGRRSLARLNTCHPDLVLVMTTALHHADCPHDMTIVYGHRTHAEQAALYAKGRTAPGPRVTNAKPGQSRHNSTPSQAVDVVPYVNGRASWSWGHINPCAAHIDRVARDLLHAGEISTLPEWGGNWRMKDGAHWQTPR